MDASLAFAVELEERDAALIDRLTLLVDLARQVDETRARAVQLGRFVERLPRDREQLAATLAEAERDLDTAAQEHAQARREVERARGEDAAATARRHEAHVATDTRTAAERRARLVARRDELDRAELAAAEEIRVLDERGRELAAELDAAPRVASPEPPEVGLLGLADWGARALAAVFVARSGLETERERVVREANELAASVLGEPLYAASVAAVRERLQERHS